MKATTAPEPAAIKAQLLLVVFNARHDSSGQCERKDHLYCLRLIEPVIVVCQDNILGFYRHECPPVVCPTTHITWSIVVHQLPPPLQKLLFR